MKPLPLVLMLASAGVAGVEGSPLAGAPETAPAREIESASRVLLSETQPSREAMQKGLADLLRSASRISAAAQLPAPTQDRLDATVASYGAGGFLEPEAVATVHRAYETVTGGAFVFPESVGSIEEARDYGRGQLDRALGALDEGRSQEAIQEVLGFVLLVTTPMEKPN